ncbi:hypothetical protein ACHAWO_013713 [Cyclotella atomus]|uniref:NAD/GMP synthase domain-containing protein n=1 Tax=Cyclotella atomus TaxID=382360 RepID=A0ABD3PHF8_9STRA
MPMNTLRCSRRVRHPCHYGRHFSSQALQYDRNTPQDEGQLSSPKVTVTQNVAGIDSNNSSAFIHTNEASNELVDNLLERTQQMMDMSAANVVAFSGGVDSSLVAALVHKSFHSHSHNNNTGSVQAVLGISNAVPQTQIEMARNVANTIGIQLREVTTQEGNDEAYIKNDGHACFVCKTHLYSTLETVANAVMKEQEESKGVNGATNNNSVILYNGTNADDTRDPTRLGLVAASNFRVHSPLDHITKDQVRQASKYLGLPNWNAAASPCLRSRLAMGVEATERHLKAVEKAEEFVRRVLVLDETRNVRVRMLSGGKAMVELDQLNGHDLSSVLREHGFEELCTEEWGFKSFGGVRGFKTGSVAAMPAEKKELISKMASL